MDTVEVCSGGQNAEASQVSFRDLPPEMRNMVYHATVDDIYHSTSKNVHWKDAVKDPPALSLVSTQVRRELLPVYFSKLTVVVDGSAGSSLDAFSSFINSIAAPDAICSGIQSLGFLFPCTTSRFCHHYALIVLSKTEHTAWKVSMQHAMIEPPRSRALQLPSQSNNAERADGAYVVSKIRFEATTSFCSSRKDLNFLATLLEARVRRWSFTTLKATTLLEVCEYIKATAPRLHARCECETDYSGKELYEGEWLPSSLEERAVPLWAENGMSVGDNGHGCSTSIL